MTDGEERRNLAAALTGACDFAVISLYARYRLGKLRNALELDQSEESTAKLRGSISEVNALLKLEEWCVKELSTPKT